MHQLAVFLVFLAFVIIGCGSDYHRHVVVHPDEGPSLDQGKWTISKEPAPPQTKEGN